MTSVTKTLNTLRESHELLLRNFEVRPCPDDVSEVMESNGYTLGRKTTTFPVDKLQPTLSLHAADDREWVDELKQEIMSDDGYVARLVIRPDGEVVEGQHRAWALIELNFDLAPVVVIYGGEDVIPDLAALKAALPKMHSDHMGQLLHMLLEPLLKNESPDDYDPPRGWEAAWNAGAAEIKRQLSARP